MATNTGASRSEWGGTWNYLQPRADDGTNVARLACPDGFSLAIPQIGWVAFSRTDHDLLARTDQGCTWAFVPRGAGAELSPPSQTCFNKVIGSSYTLTRWDVSFGAEGEAEVIRGTSHQPGGDCEFTLPKGRRTEVRAGGADTTAPFVGTWTYDGSDANGGNVEQLSCPGDVPGTVQPAVASGTVSIAKTGDHQIRATTDDGCSWSLQVDGNTAELSPVPQTCSATSARAFWSMASDGHEAAAFTSGTESRVGVACRFLLATGKLRRR